jgi:hypothetical protein
VVTKVCACACQLVVKVGTTNGPTGMISRALGG